jgi:hypothetical protein
VRLVGQTFPLARAADADAAIERRVVFGKTLLLAGAEAQTAGRGSPIQ